MSRSFRPDVPRLEATPREIFLSRRDFMKGTGSALLLAPMACSFPLQDQDESTILKAPLKFPKGYTSKRNAAYVLPKGQRADLTPRLVAGTHNNFYEFLPGRGGPVHRYTEKFEVDPWTIEIGGLVKKPMKLGLEDIFKFAHEERLYHFRCVERWAMNVPWSGFPLSKLLEKVEPKSDARYIRFVTAKRPSQMPGLREDSYPWPYHEALRLNEAMNELTMVVTGAYGEPLLKQHGAPLRIIVPWKYGYKSPKSIVKIELLADRPTTFWAMPQYAHEYGFISNVNPNIPHPRWSQSISHWLDTRERFPTPIFNGYEKYVAKLYPDEPRKPQEPLTRGKTAR